MTEFKKTIMEEMEDIEKQAAILKALMEGKEYCGYCQTWVKRDDYIIMNGLCVGCNNEMWDKIRD